VDTFVSVRGTLTHEAEICTQRGRECPGGVRGRPTWSGCDKSTWLLQNLQLMTPSPALPKRPVTPRKSHRYYKGKARGQQRR